ncbi:hypothetical protein [Desulfosporosinus sp.]|uniref:hypothetical protein n=1 Tax=Desulfosporosinus sp. TaxID=157907 RepID=UPI00260AF31F|nr:hypothetical protein [Desulfosporosinus sp.]
MTDIPNPLTLSTFPIIFADDKNNINIAGTSILAEHNEHQYLLTAAHVLRDPGTQYPLYILLNDAPFPLKGPAIMSKLPQKESDPDLDIAYFPLEFELDLASQLTGYATITLREFDENIDYAREHYFIFGYPWRKAKYKRTDNELIATPLQYVTEKITNKRLYEKYSRPEESHILINYKPKSTKKADGSRYIAPYPHGISGGPLFRALVNKENELILLILEGLLIEWKESHAIVATRKESIRKFIDANREGYT